MGSVRTEGSGMRRLFSLIHTYGGFLFFPLLIIFGLSALHINHGLKIFEQGEEWDESHRQINVQFIENKQQMAEAIRDSLGLMGWCPYWTQNRNNTRYRFDITHNGAEYKIDTDLQTGNVKIRRRAKGFGSVLNSLHFFNENLPSGTGVVNSWKHYKNVAFFYFAITIISGIYFFIKRKTGIKTGLIVLMSVFLISAGLIIYVWQIG